MPTKVRYFLRNTKLFTVFFHFASENSNFRPPSGAFSASTEAGASAAGAVVFLFQGKIIVQKKGGNTYFLEFKRLLM